MAQYAKAEYWNERYLREADPFEWYQDFKAIKKYLEPYINNKSKVLVTGCGNSRLSEHIFADAAPKKVTSVDISDVVISQMSEGYRNEPKLQFATMDVRKLEFADGSFDLIVDKGCLDCLMCADEAEENAETTLSEYHRVLSAKGAMVCLSYGNADERLHYFNSPKYTWKVKPVQSLKKPSVDVGDMAEEVKEIDLDADDLHFVYTAVKE